MECHVIAKLCRNVVQKECQISLIFFMKRVKVRCSKKVLSYKHHLPKTSNAQHDIKMCRFCQCDWLACEGHMLVSWLLSLFTSQHNVCQRVSQRDLRLIAIQFCTHLLAAHVIKKLEEESNNPPNGIFKVWKLLRSIIRKFAINTKWRWWM